MDLSTMLTFVAAAACSGALGCRDRDPIVEPIATVAAAPATAADPGAVLVRLDGEPALTVAGYHALLAETLVPDGGRDEAEVRREALEKVIDLCVIAAQARRELYAPLAPPAGDRLGLDRSLALALVRREVGDPTRVSDDEARRYVAARPELLAASDPDRPDLLAVKLRILSERFRERVAAWRTATEIAIDETLVAGLDVGGVLR